MTQKGNLFKGQKKNKSIPLNRHGKITHTRKGKKVAKPSKVTKEMDADRVMNSKISVAFKNVMIRVHWVYNTLSILLNSRLLGMSSTRGVITKTFNFCIPLRLDLVGLSTEIDSRVQVLPQ
ncbi:uncharacterized protein LOC131001330 isoform X1 [Salvia miltiorrhiza]|uniref:uncharacterized protein LOC131001330 isoform X1 n=1 Tax=Salvia miltiorrhiza TaxID=226208 RepID=UPI0025AC670D|nr:uncharacterized protein LOC131001330 isoform X1 [Salvia miltiorrhiza]XP_057783677.1 uncharacterized protein LOC131001330 isoform X1 [Salvia miltiorrhiza]